MQQQVGQLRDREDENQVEKQLDARHARVVLFGAGPQE